MLIWDSLNDNKKRETVIKSLVWKSVIDVYKNERGMDITSYLVSIRIKWKTIFIKTNKPIINTELLMFADKIKEVTEKKLLVIWIRFFEFDIKYI